LIRDPLEFFYLLGMSFLPLLVAVGLSYWKVSKGVPSLSRVKLALVLLASALASVATFFGSIWVLVSGPHSDLSPWEQPINILSVLVGYFLGTFVASRLRRQLAN
jgi:glucan phosphoethanolaminetransferase (alkaline phosphatase superfamily)